ncbi:hypothetical protein MRX96_043064 [Rhipicephalus microplus]
MSGSLERHLLAKVPRSFEEHWQAKVPPPPKKAQQTQQSPADFPETERREVQAEKSHPAPTATSLASCVDTSTGSLQSQCKPSGEPLPTADSKATDVPFTEIGGGKYHVKNGLVIGSQQAEKILGHKKPSLCVRKQLSPDKVALIIDTVTHWGSCKGVPVKETVDNLSTILSQKIQDIRRNKKKEN